jgi:hypothetical protein
MDSHRATNPASVKGWLQWLASDTLPQALTYRLVMRLRLVDIPSSRVIWQDQATTEVPAPQLTTLSRSAQQVGSNLSAVQAASMRVSDKLAGRVRPWIVKPGVVAAPAKPNPLSRLGGMLP